MKKSMLVSALFLAPSAFAFTLNSSSDSSMQGWADPNVQFVVNTASCPGVDVAGIISDAAAVWNRVSTSKIHVTYGGTTSGTGASAPPTVACLTSTFASVTGADINYVPAAGGGATTNSQLTSGALYLNLSGGAANITHFERAKLTIIIAHEIGHVLGLGHSPDPQALMYYDSTNRTVLNLGQDDIDGISYLYPADSGTSVTGCGLVRAPRPPTPGGLLGLALAFLLPTMMYGFLRARSTRV